MMTFVSPSAQSFFGPGDDVHLQVNDECHILFQDQHSFCHVTKILIMENTIKQSSVNWLTILQASIGIVYIWFGVLKFFPTLSPAEDLANQTIHLLTFGLLSKQVSLFLLAVWEVTAGLMLVFKIKYRIVFWLVIVHMICTFTPLVLLPQLSFTNVPYGLTLVGQYIIKNIVIISALFVIREHTK